MKSITDVSIALDVISENVQDDHRKVVVELVLKRRKYAGTHAQQQIRELLRRAIRLDGYRRADEAPSTLLHPKVLKLLEHGSHLWIPVLRVWVDAQPELRDAAREILEAGGVQLVDVEEVPDFAFAGIWSADEAEDWVEQLRARVPTARDDDLLLMLSLNCGIYVLPDGEQGEELMARIEAAAAQEDEADTTAELADIPDSEPEERDQEPEPRRSFAEASTRLLAVLHALTADAAEWADVEVFAADIKALAEQKQREREARVQLEQVLRTLREEAAEALAYFDEIDLSRWNASVCPLEEAAHRADQVRELQRAVLQHAGIRQPALTRGAERQRLQDLSLLESRIDELATELSAALGVTPELPPDGSDPIAGNEPEREPLLRDGISLIAEGVPDANGGGGASADESIKQVEPLVSIAGTVGTLDTSQDDRASRLADLSQDTVSPASAEVIGAADETPSVWPQDDISIATTATHLDDHTVSDADSSGDEPVLPEEATIARDTSSDTNIEWDLFMWELVGEGDLAGAYWIARWKSPSPPWLLAAAQGAAWLAKRPGAFILDLLAIAEQEPPDQDDAEILLGLAASAVTTLIAPDAGMAHWVQAPANMPVLHKLIEPIREYSKHNIALRPEDLAGVAGSEQDEDAIRDAAIHARHWLDQAHLRRRLKRFSDVWRKLLHAPSGALYTMLLPVIEDQRGMVEDVRALSKQWEDESYALEQVNQIDRELVGAKWRRIEGGPCQQILQDIGEACAAAHRWCLLVERARLQDTRGNWRLQQADHLRDDAQKVQREAEDFIRDLCQNHSDYAVRVAGQQVWRMLRQLWATLNLPLHHAAEHPAMSDQWDWLAEGQERLDRALERRLLLLPGVRLDSNGQPIGGDPTRDALRLLDAYAERTTYAQAVSSWIKEWDYRAANELLSAVQDDAARMELSRQLQTELDGSRAALKARVDVARDAIEQGVVDGIIFDEQRAQLNAIVAAIAPETVWTFAPVFEELTGIDTLLREARAQRLAQLAGIWQELQRRLGTAPIDQERQNRLRILIEAALSGPDTRVVEELLDRLRQVLDERVDLEESWFVTTAERDILSEFKTQAPSIESWLGATPNLRMIEDDIRKGDERARIRTADLPRARREEAIEAVSAWRALKPGPKGRDRQRNLETIALFLGFTFERQTQSPVEIPDHGDDWLHARIAMSANDLTRPIPQFGSQAHGRYDVVCLWERPGADTIAARLRKLRLNVPGVIVVYFGRLSHRQRRDVTRMSREQDFSLAVLDEVLLLFLAQERDARLPIFLRAALPFTTLDPYTPFQAGDVPPEMFFGRRSMVGELQRATGSCLVYGGRQLGKSALLRHVQREFHHPEREQYAWVRDIKVVGDPLADQPPLTLWTMLRDDFKRNGLLSGQITTDRPVDIQRHIRDMFRKFPDRRVLVLFDEADNLLEASAEENFAVVDELRTLMFDTERRFKVVFAGLHHVQRFQNIPNQPLAHFGRPLRIGPLEPEAAQQLVRQPLEILGYRFHDNSTVLRILSYTNYHPGLIQIFCQELLQQLHGRSTTTLPPYKIEARDVEVVYPRVRDRIRERFDWTLALDPHYQAIAWSMIFDQIGVRDSYARDYAPGEIMRLSLDAWQQGFINVGTEALRGLLDEMCGLGVLVRNATGHYRLRSPNLVRLMGTDEDILARLSELSKQPPPDRFVADRHHALLERKGHVTRYSPLTYAQERSLNRPGVGIVFATEAGGLSSLMTMFQRFVPRTDVSTAGRHLVAPAGLDDGARLRAWVDQQVRGLKSVERIVVSVTPANGTPEKLESLVGEAVQLVGRATSRSSELQIHVVLDAASTWAWFALPEQRRAEREDSVGAIAVPRPWDVIGIRQRLGQQNMLSSDEVCRAVLDATGGWPFLLDELLDRCAYCDDPRSAAHALVQELGESASPLTARFREALGLQDQPIARRVLQFIITYKPSPDLVVPEMIGGEPTLTHALTVQAVAFLTRLHYVTVDNDTLIVDPLILRIMNQATG